jgi:predicted nucleic acid binding AN1-type Zn finger protein
MEFYDLGKNCSVCNKRDFLPFQCDLCGKTLCLDHRDYVSHDCPKYTSQKPTIQCPLCQQNILVGQDANLAVERHIQRGCPKEIKTKKVCSLKGCDEFAMIDCKDCRSTFCLKHRADIDHNCPKMKQVKPTVTPTMKKKPPSVTFSNTKSNPIGSSNIDPIDRFDLDVYFPRKTGKQAIHMFFSKNWKIGKILDTICKQGEIHNENPTTTDLEKRLNLFHIPTKSMLPPAEYLKDLQFCKKKDPVLLEYGTKIEFSDIEKEEIEENKCNVQ